MSMKTAITIHHFTKAFKLRLDTKVQKYNYQWYKLKVLCFLPKSTLGLLILLTFIINN